MMDMTTETRRVVYPVEDHLEAPNWGEPRVLAALFGGQGSLNVNSWSPDSRAFAFVSYRLLEHGG